MGSLIEELQFAAQDSNASLLDLLRKAKVLALKLDVPDLLRWVEHELNGYGQGDEVPTYRLILGRVEALTPLYGWKPVFFQDERAQQIA